jgi:hypothetical protein
MINKLINETPTDTSGRWVGVNDVRDLVKRVINECARFTDHKEELYKHFEVEIEKQ